MARARAAIPSPVATEVEAYGHIRDGLRDVGWIVKNPSLGTGGQVWTQNQCLSHPEIKAALGLTRPENIIKVSESCVWVIESKASRRQLKQAIDEAMDDYCKPINTANGQFRARFATGVAGDAASGYLISTMIRLEDGKWRRVTINGRDATGFLSPASVRFLLENNTANVQDYAPPQYLFLQAAERINEHLHLGGINKNDRAKVMAALLLSVLDEPPNLDTSLPVLIGEINSRSKAKLVENEKPEFAQFVEIIPPTNTTNHVKYKAALIHTIQELLNLNIRSAMNSRTDVLGEFYEVFLKYGNGAKEIGIVLTPRHVTRFAVEAAGISSKDIVLDLACGTGGFLVAAFDHVRRTCTPAQLDKFKEHNLFGIEQESAIALLAIVNMIFRGDGKHNIVEGNCFTTFLSEHTVRGHASAVFTKEPPPEGSEPITRVLMNPPFALKGSREKEFHFVSQALSMMADGCTLFALVPLDVLFGAREEKIWRSNDLLAKNTLVSVVTMPAELFVPSALKQVAGIFVRKGIPHPRSQSVLWVRVSHDGHIVSKKRRLAASDFIPPRDEPDQLSEILPNLKNFVANPGSISVNVPQFCKTAPIDFSDPLLELIPEAYIDGPPITKEGIEESVDEMLRETVSFLIRFKKESLVGKFDA